uniref:Ubiquitin-like protease family profile domain-containing protein n=1 Tax=Amphimedon queenslandica TaxID=400682 RepID=A0A1X7UC64_AMPQE
MAASSIPEHHCSTVSFNTCICEYHAYMKVWTPVMGETMDCECEPGNSSDPYAVAVIKNHIIVGHVPWLISAACFLFLQHDGHTISTTVSDLLIPVKRRHLEIDLNTINDPANDLEVEEQIWLEGWIVASTIGNDKEVSVYDSIYTSVDAEARHIIEKKFGRGSVIRMEKCPNQNGSCDCGVFAIAKCTCICYELKIPANFDQTQMRQHLLECLQQLQLKPFPKHMFNK